jgi:choline dehydrogenase-like flavoprotein
MNVRQFTAVIVGTGFASSFFLEGFLKRAKPSDRILVLERGQKHTHAWQLQNKRTSSIESSSVFVNKNQNKPWIFNVGFGGGSNCWWAVTPRLMPNDFRLRSTYGVGVDWPLSYDELEAYYTQVEARMAVSGPEDGSPFPKSRPYPQPPHHFSEPDKLLKAAYPDTYFHQPTARARVATANRPPCCANGVCHLCPINAKFSILNEMQDIYEDPRVELITEANVQSIETSGGVATGVSYLKDGQILRVKGDIVVLGANALFNSYLLLRSNLHHPVVGKYLNEQVSVNVIVDLDGIDNYQGSTSITGHGYMFYDGMHRTERAACLIESHNIPFRGPALRPELGKWRQRMVLKFIFEDLPSEDNFVAIDAESSLPTTVYQSHSVYAQRGIESLPELLPQFLKALPVEQVQIYSEPNGTEAHILGTTRMGNDPNTSIVDKYLIHHQLRNLVVLGSSVFPTGSPANPTLTLSALSLWSANHLVG